MTRRREITPPWYYRAPLRRPFCATSMSLTLEELAWDLCDTWHTSAEWMAWCRRHYGRPCYYSRGRWHYPVRPIIAAHRVPWSTLKLRKLP